MFEPGLPDGFCLLWDLKLLTLHAVSDSLIALAYFLIPFFLIRLVPLRRDLKFNWIFFSLSVFVVACGLTHVMGVVTLWHPVYWVSGIVKAITAAISLGTVVLLMRMTPQILAMPDELANKRFRDLIDTASDSILQVDAKGTIVMANKTTTQMFGYGDVELLGFAMYLCVRECLALWDKGRICMGDERTGLSSRLISA